MTQLKKKQSAADLFNSSLDLFDFKDCLDYQAKLKIMDDGSVNVIHILRMDFNKYTAQIRELEKVLSAIARKKFEYHPSDPEKTKIFVETLKLKNLVIPGKPGSYLIGSTYIAHLKNDQAQMYYNEGDFWRCFQLDYPYEKHPIKDKYVVNIFKNSSTGIIYDLPEQAISILLKEKNKKYELLFNIENTKDKTDPVIKSDKAFSQLKFGEYDTFDPLKGIKQIEILPAIISNDVPFGGPFTAVICVQSINLDQNTAMNIKDLSASYELVPVN